MPWGRNGQLVEAIDCAGCNVSLEWHGDLPEDEEDWLCNVCAEDAAHARGRAEGAAIAAGIIALGEWARRCGTSLGDAKRRCWRPCAFGASRHYMCPNGCGLGDRHDGGCRCVVHAVRGTP